MSGSNFKRPASQFVVNKEYIFKQIDAGIFLKEIFDQLVSENKFTGEYSHFCRLVRNEKKRINEQKNEDQKEKEENNLSSTKEENEDNNNDNSELDDDDSKFIIHDPFNKK